MAEAVPSRRAWQRAAGCLDQVGHAGGRGGEGSNPKAAQGGADVESDESLFARLDQYRKNRAASGNIADYVQWGMEVSVWVPCRCCPSGMGLARSR